jgi:hypothetical protein
MKNVNVYYEYVQLINNMEKLKHYYNLPEKDKLFELLTSINKNNITYSQSYLKPKVAEIHDNEWLLKNKMQLLRQQYPMMRYKDLYNNAK